MINKDIREIIEILMEIPKDKYHKFKAEVLSDEENNSQRLNDLFKAIFSLIEKRRPELVEGGVV